MIDYQGVIGFEVAGWEPWRDIAWSLCGERGRTIARREAARLLVSSYLRQLASGVDKNGRLLRPIHIKTRRSRADNINPVTGRTPYSPMGIADPSNAPLQATGSRSRTRTLLMARITVRGLFIYWRVDSHTGQNWGDVLARHAAGYWQRFHDGQYGYVPPRDVIGLAPQYAAFFRQQFQGWWLANRVSLARPGFILTGGDQSVLLKVPTLGTDLPTVKPTPATVKATRKPPKPTDAFTRHTYVPGTVIEGMVGDPRLIGNKPLRSREKVYRGPR